MYEVLIWGISKGYDILIKSLNFKQIKVNALISSYDECIKSIDNIDVIKPEDIKNFNYEFIIVASSFFDEIVKVAQERGGITRDKLINAKVFELNGFDFNRYISIRNKNISIISDDCWGGFLYNSLDLKFNTPFINFFINADNYFKIISNINYYLKCNLEVKNIINKFGYFSGFLDDAEIYFMHDNSIKQIRESWNRRISRFNFENYFVKMTLNNDNDAIKFNNLEIDNKIGFYSKYIEQNLKSILYFPEWNNIKIRYKYHWNFYEFTRDMVIYNRNFNRYFDILKLLNNEQDFLRNIKYSF